MVQDFLEQPSKYKIAVIDVNKIEYKFIFIFNYKMERKSISKKSNKLKQRTDKEFEQDIQDEILKNTKVPKTNYCGLLATKEGMMILKKMSWVEIEDLTDYEFYG